jgi:uncharacterized phiE125 gp8 family phage protein
MWYPSTVETPVASEPVTIGQARQQARTDGDQYHDDELTRLITVARSHVEQVCGVRLGTQTIVAKCDSFADMCRLSEAPIQSVTSIAYVDTDGVGQTVSASVYELRSEGLDASIVLKFNQSWPSIQPGSRITLTVVAGFETPDPAYIHAMLVYLAGQFQNHEPVEVAGMTTFDALLINHRRNA